MTPLKKLTAMEKLITLGFIHYYTCDNEVLKECIILNETQVDGIDEIKTEMRLFEKQRRVAFQSLEKEDKNEIESSLNIFNNDIGRLIKFLNLCKEGHNEIEKTLFEPLKEYIEMLQSTIVVLQDAISQ